jgi:hypothetical protein
MNAVVRAARLAHPVMAAAVVVLVFVQVYLIAAFIFGRPGALSAHETVGGIVEFVEVAVVVTAAVGWRHDRLQVGLSVALLIVGVLQVALAKNLGNSPTVHAFHGLLALAVVLLAWQIALRGSQAFGTVARSRG